MASVQNWGTHPRGAARPPEVQESLLKQAVEESPEIKWPSAKRNSVSETFGGHLDRCWRDALDGSGNVFGYATETDISQQQPFLGIGRDARRRSVHFRDSDLSASVALKGQYRSSQHAYTLASAVLTWFL